MKRLALMVAAFALFYSAPVFSADTKTYPSPQEGASNVYKQVFDNDRVRVSEIVFAVGQKAPMHTHAYPHVVYVIEGGELTLTHPNGSSTVVKAKAGEVLWLGPETHEALNTGATVVRGTVTEIK